MSGTLELPPPSVAALYAVRYEYETGDGPRTFQHRLERADFLGGPAGCTAEVPGLVRCRSVSIARRS